TSIRLNMGKRKAGTDGAEYIGTPLSSITADQVEALKAASTDLPTNLRCLVPLLESIRAVYDIEGVPHRRPIAKKAATDIKRTIVAAEEVSVDYNENDLDYVFHLKEHEIDTTKSLSPHFAAVVKTLKSSRYILARHDESLSRTILDLILVDRLNQLEDKDTYHHLLVSAEVPVSIKVKDIDGGDVIYNGRADWTIGYGKTKSETGSILVVVEAKPLENGVSGLPQLLIYMAAIHEARRLQEKTNQSVFGIVSDGGDFTFAFLDQNKKLYVSQKLQWVLHSSTILSYIDMILLDAIHSSPHTTPVKSQNQILNRYPHYLTGNWQFGEDEDGEESEEEMEVVDVVRRDGPAVYHNDIREELLAAANKIGTYKFKRSRDTLEHDVTAFHQDQYKKGPTDKLTYEAGIWCDSHGRVILDLDGTPVRNYMNIPVVLSSQLEGCYMEAMMRQHPKIKLQDFVARMPKDQAKRNALSARMRMYRVEACCISWKQKEGSQNINAYIDNLLPAQYIKTNYTECFRDLTNLEVEEIRTVNDGSYMERAGPRRLTDDVRQAQQAARSSNVARLRGARQGPISSDHTGDGLLLGSRRNFVIADRENREDSESSVDESIDGMDESVLEDDEDEPRITDDDEFSVGEIDPDEVDEVMPDADEEADSDAVEETVWTDDDLIDASQEMTWVGILCRVPVSQEHIALITHLLHPTRQEYQQRLHEVAPPTDPTASYFDQYKELERASIARGELLLIRTRWPHVRVRRITSSAGIEWNTDVPVRVAEEVRNLIEDVKLGG
ncbi:MAG: hypothetical protein Q9187_002908, partial [Circinaria calcarea]